MSEATAINALLGAVLGMTAVEGVPVGDDQARRAAVFLSARAHETLGGGLDGEAVDSRWARRSRARIGVCEWCREVRETVVSCLGCGEELCLRCWGEGNDRLCGVCWHRSEPVFDEVVIISGVL